MAARFSRAEEAKKLDGCAGTCGVGVWLPPNPAARDDTGGVRCEIWHNLEGGQITDALADGDLSGPADETRSLDSFELNPAPEEPQACALRGFIIPPATGDYVFVISGDDTALLYLSKNQSYAAAKIIATG